MTDLFSCPHCGESPHLRSDARRGYQVSCVCGAAGPYVKRGYGLAEPDQRGEAIRLWNRLSERRAEP